jgi:GxxExxY protein
MNENEVSKMVLDCCFNIHRNLGPGLFESVYEQILAYELSKKELKFKRQNAIPLNYGDIKFNVGFRLDYLIENLVIVELKSVESILPLHKKQLLTYLKITRHKLGLLINFNSILLRDGIIRIVNNL